MQNIPDQLLNFAVWSDNNELLGIADATLPNLTPLKETKKGAGIAGEYESRAIGHYGTMKLQLNWRKATKQALSLASPEGKLIELRAAGQSVSPESYKFGLSKYRITIRASGSDMQPGKFDPGTAMGTVTELECLYFKLELDDEVLVEIDKLNFKSVINGVDELEEVRSILGK